MATTADAKGYWLGALDGGIFSYGDAPFYGSMGSTPLNQPIVGMAATPDAKGYWLVAADGGIFSYGDAGFYGSTGSLVLNAPIVGMATTHDGKGYWLVAADGGIFPYGDAGFYGSAGAENLPDPVVGMVASPDGGGYLLATANGVVLPFGDAQAYGGLSLDPTATQISAIIGNNQGTGYWLLDPQAWQYDLAQLCLLESCGLHGLALVEPRRGVGHRLVQEGGEEVVAQVVVGGDVAARAIGSVLVVMGNALVHEGPQLLQRRGDQGGQPRGKGRQQIGQVGAGPGSPVAGMYASPKPTLASGRAGRRTQRDGRARTRARSPSRRRAPARRGRSRGQGPAVRHARRSSGR